MPDREAVEKLVLDSVRLLADDFEIEALREADAESPLFGESGALDSMALVNLIADIEDAVAERFGSSIALADERAMSARNSPFKNAATLADAVLERLEK